MTTIIDQQVATYGDWGLRKPVYIYRFKIRTRRVKGGYKVSYLLHIQDARSNKSLLVMSLRNWYPIVDYLSSDDRYVRDRDYLIVRDRRYTKAGKVDIIEIAFHNPECARRVTVFMLSILGVEDKPSWINKMIHVMRKLSPEAIDFWLNTAYDRFATARNGLSQRLRLLRVAKAMRTLYERNAG